ncbi:MAG: NAD-binding protein [Lachnospiraceae bacterium]|nr:NAD-binding protein [Lachnospiraceae bacterium]
MREKSAGDMRLKKEKGRSWWSRFRRRLADAKIYIGVSAIILIFIFICVVYWRVEYISQGDEVKLGDVFLWNFATVLGQDYAERYPTSVGGRIVGIFLLLFGMFGVSGLTGLISSALVEHRLRSGKEKKKLQEMKNHVVICGWKSDLELLLLDILRKNRDLKTQDIVLINQEGEEKNRLLTMNEKLRDITIVHGDYSEETVLRSVNIGQASIALILGDINEGADPELADSRVLVTVLLVRSLNPQIHICAEVHTKKYKTYLEYQKCNEIIYTEEYTRFVLSSATGHTGMAKVLSSLFDNGDGISIQVAHVEPQWIGKTYGELFADYKKNGHILLIGLLANMGNEKDLKYTALARAQKTPDISKLVANLQEVKNIERNQPLLNLPDDFVIRENMGAIILAAEV